MSDNMDMPQGTDQEIADLTKPCNEAAIAKCGTEVPEPTLAERLEEMRKESVMQNKQLRVDLDKCLQILKGHMGVVRSSQERSIAMRKLQEAIMWLGMDNKALHEENPYPNSMKPENAIVEPTADGLRL